MVCVRAFCVERYAGLQSVLNKLSHPMASDARPPCSTPRRAMLQTGTTQPLRLMRFHLLSNIAYITNHRSFLHHSWASLENYVTWFGLCVYIAAKTNTAFYSRECNWPAQLIVQSKAPYTLSVKLRLFFSVWGHAWRKNWVNCAVLTGSSTGIRTVLSSLLSQRTAQFTQGMPQFPQFTCRHHDGIISRHTRF